TVDGDGVRPLRRHRRHRGPEDPARPRPRLRCALGHPLRCLQEPAQANLAPRRQLAPAAEGAHRVREATLPGERAGGEGTPRIRRILELARWPPSGDNSQPWRFEIRSHGHLVVHTRADGLGVYDLEGIAALTPVGAMLETVG